MFCNRTKEFLSQHGIAFEERDVSNSWLRIQLQVRDRHHLAQVIKTIRHMPDVQRVFRTLA